MAVINGVDYRSKDLEKIDLPWEERDVIFKFDDDWTIEWVRTPADLELEGGIMGHCAGSHAFWVHKGVEILLSLRNPHGTSKATLHIKPVKHWGKKQPEDEQLNPYGGIDQKIDGLKCGYQSTTYEGRREITTDNPQFELNGEKVGVIATSVRYGSSMAENAQRLCTFLEAVGVDPEVAKKHLRYYLTGQYY